MRYKILFVLIVSIMIFSCKGSDKAPSSPVITEPTKSVAVTIFQWQAVSTLDTGESDGVLVQGYMIYCATLPGHQLVLPVNVGNTLSFYISDVIFQDGTWYCSVSAYGLDVDGNRINSNRTDEIKITKTGTLFFKGV